MQRLYVRLPRLRLGACRALPERPIRCPAPTCYQMLSFGSPAFENAIAIQALALARDQWRKVKAEGHDATYWQQDERGRWQRKA